MSCRKKYLIQRGLKRMTKCGMISIIGRPNVGKSTLLNALVGEKVAIVSPKPQTTRNKITGILTRGDDQFIFADTPGLHRSESRLGDMMMRSIFEAVGSVDAAILVAGADKFPGKPERLLLERVRQAELPCLLVLNKTDAAEKAEILPVIAAYSQMFDFAAIMPVSAKTGDGVPELLDELSKLLPQQPHIFPDDALTDQPERVLAAELVREQLMLKLDQELPHSVACATERFETRDDGITEIDVLIVCEKQNHKSIIIGRQGAMLKTVGSLARVNIEKMLGTQVFLQLWVKVKEDWKNSPSFLADLETLAEPDASFE